MQHLVIAMDTTSSMDQLLPDCSKKRIEWATHIVLDTIKSLPDDTLITLFLLIGDSQHRMIAEYPNTTEAVKQISSLSIPLQAGIISFWQDLKAISQEQFHNVPWNLLCVTDGEDLKNDEHADEFFEDMERVYPRTSISIMNLGGNFRKNQHGTEIKFPKTVGIYTTDDADTLVASIKHQFDRQLSTSLQSNPLPLNASTTVLPLIPVQKNDYDIVIRCLRRVIPYLEQVTGLRYYPVTTWLVSTNQMGVLRPPEEKPKGSSRADATKKFQALFAIVQSFSLNFHVRHKDPRFNDYTPFSRHSDTVQALRGAAECIPMVYNKETGVNLERIDKYIRIRDFSDTPHTIENLIICLQEMIQIWRAIASENPEDVVHLDHQYFPGYREREYNTIPYFDFLPTQIQKLVEELLHQGYWNGQLKRLCDLFEATIIEWIPLLYRLSRTSSEEGTATFTTRAAGLYIPEDSSKSDRLVNIAKACGYPSIFRSGAGGSVVIDLELLRDSTADAIRFEKSLTSLLVHEHAHAVFTEGINGKHDQSHINQTDDALTVNESLAEWMEVNYWRHDQEMSCQTWDHIYMGDFPQWKYAGAEFVESRFIEKGTRGVQALLISLRKGSEHIMKLLQKY